MDANAKAALAEPFYYALLGTAAGLAVGAVIVLFGRGLEFCVAFGAAHFPLYVWFLPAVGVLTAAMLRRFGRGGIGMAAAFRASRGEGKGFPLRNAAFQFAGAWSAHLFCASVGREGAGIQIGAAVGESIGARVPLCGADKILLIAGMAAGFSALFGTPVCALFFALEVTVVGALRLRALVAAGFASFAAYLVALSCGFLHAAEGIELVVQPGVSLFARVAVLGGACGLTGLLFCFLRRCFSSLFGACKNAYLRAAAAGLLLAGLLYLTDGRYSGLGTNLIGFAMEGAASPADFVLKMAFTAAFLSAGFLGGEVTTFFAAGACLGCCLGGFLGIPAELAACIGYAAVFGAATNTLIAPVFLCVELFGGGILPYAAVCCVAAYLCNFGHSVYDQRVREDIVRRALGGLRKKRPLPLPQPLFVDRKG